MPGATMIVLKAKESNPCNRARRRIKCDRFCVAKSFIQKLLKQYKDTGDIHPQPQGGSPETKLNQEQLIDLVEIIETHNDATLEELCDLLEERVKLESVEPRWEESRKN
jgi:transposase